MPGARNVIYQRSVERYFRRFKEISGSVSHNFKFGTTFNFFEHLVDPRHDIVFDNILRAIVTLKNGKRFDDDNRHFR